MKCCRGRQKSKKAMSNCKGTDDGPAALARIGDYITDSVLPIFKSGQADLIGDEHMLASDIALETAPGHTPGLTLVRATRRDRVFRPNASPAASTLSDMEHALLRGSRS